MSAINSVTATSASTSTSSAAGVSQTLTAADFLQILVAEFSNQDPTSPTDPTQYATQMVDFSDLGQLQNINQDLQNNQTPQSSLMQAASAYIGREVVAPGDTVGVQNGAATAIAYAPTTTDTYTANVFNAAGQQVDSVSLGEMTGGTVQNFNWSPPSSTPAGLYTVQIVNSGNAALGGLLEQGVVNSVAVGSNGSVSLNVGNLVVPESQITSVAQPASN
ncbi:MAG: flagellar hook assembly protein FlgD [Candidatus Binataceae bacterium]